MTTQGLLDGWRASLAANPSRVPATHSSHHSGTLLIETRTCMCTHVCMHMRVRMCARSHVCLHTHARALSQHSAGVVPHAPSSRAPALPLPASPIPTGAYARDSGLVSSPALSRVATRPTCQDGGIWGWHLGLRSISYSQDENKTKPIPCSRMKLVNDWRGGGHPHPGGSASLGKGLSLEGTKASCISS